MLSLLKNFKCYRVSAPVAAGTTDVKSSGVLVGNKQTVLFGVCLGTITSTATITIKAQGSDTDVDGNYVDITGASFTVADDQDNKIALLEVVRPTYKYVRCYVDLGTANTVIDLIWAMVGNFFRTYPVTQPSDITSYGNVSKVF